MSVFDLATTAGYATSGAQNLRYTEINPESANLSGQVRWRWQSASNHYWIPCQTYMILDFSIGKTAGALVAGDSVSLAKDTGACVWNLVTHQINGVNCGVSNNPAVDSIVMKRAFMSSEFKNTVGDIFNLTDDQTLNFTGSTTQLAWVPPLGLYDTKTGIPGGSHLLTASLATNLIERMVADGRTTAGLTIKLEKARLMVCHVQPNEIMEIPKTVFVNTIDLQTSSMNHNSNGSASLVYSVPPSSRKLFVSSQLSNLGSNDAKGATFLGGCQMSSLFVDYAGAQSPTAIYADQATDYKRKYFDLYAEKIMSGASGYETVKENYTEPLTLHAFNKSESDTSTTATLKMSADGSTSPSLIYMSALHHNSIVLQYSPGSGLLETVNFVSAL
jgi:hypothetical protein